jgi:hypothetical protein
MPVIVQRQSSNVVVQRDESPVVQAVSEPQVHTTTQPNTANVVPQLSQLVNVAMAGPMGPPGETDGATFNAVAAATIHGGRAVRIENGEISHPSISTPAHAPQIIGIAVQSGSVGTTLSVRAKGQMSDIAWNWSPGFVFAGNAGILTQTAPATGYIVAVARVIDPTTIDVDVEPPIFRG